MNPILKYNYIYIYIYCYNTNSSTHNGEREHRKVLQNGRLPRTI
jgi:hypothetical protein